MRGLDLANALEELKDGHGVMLFEQRVDAVLSQPRRALPERFEPPDVELCLAYCAIFLCYFVRYRRYYAFPPSAQQ